MVISHDRWFLDRVATHLLAYEGDGEDPAKWYWLDGEEAARPHRVTYRKLTRD